MEVSTYSALENYRTRIAAINETLYKICTEGTPNFFIGPDERNRHEFEYFCHMRERDYRALCECLDPYRTWFRAAPIKRNAFYEGLNLARENSIMAVHVSSLELDYWQLVHDVAYAAPECCWFMFGLEPWFVASLLENKVLFKELLFTTTYYCRASYIFNLIGIDCKYGTGSCLAMLQSNYRLSICYANPTPSGRFGQGSVFL